MNESAVLSTYQHFLDRLRRMLQLCETGQWDALVALEGEHRQAAQALPAVAPPGAGGFQAHGAAFSQALGDVVRETVAHAERLGELLSRRQDVILEQLARSSAETKLRDAYLCE